LSGSQWLSVIEDDYLSTFIRAGGAAVKVAIAPHDQIGVLASNLVDAAGRAGYVSLQVGGIAERVHLVDKLFHQVAKQIDWQGLANEFMNQALTTKGYELPDGKLGAGAIATANALDPDQVRLASEKLIFDRVLKDVGMVKNFRIAMSLLCQAEVDDDDISRERAEERPRLAHRRPVAD